MLLTKNTPFAHFTDVTLLNNDIYKEPHQAMILPNQENEGAEYVRQCESHCVIKKSNK